MIFQTLDDKSECVGIYTNDELFFALEDFPSDLTTTWKYAPYLEGMDLEYVSLYLEGQKIGNCIPEYLKDDWNDAVKKLTSFRRSLRISQVNADENCFFDLVPKRFLIEFCETKNKITKYIMQTIPKPKRYEFYKHVSIMLTNIENREVMIDRPKIRSYAEHKKLGNQARSILTSTPNVRYNQFGTKTGRLTTKKDTFPILTLNKDFRSAVKPQNDFFVEIDFNGAEVRTLLGLLKKEQPVGDVHDFHLREIFKGAQSRDQAKTLFFAWLYGARAAVDDSTSLQLNEFYEKDKLLKDYWDGDAVTTYYKKRIPCSSRHHALNYLVQSTAAELTLKQALKLDYLLRAKGSGSAIAFLIHDAVVIDMKKEDEHLLKILVDMMRSTNFGNFMVNVEKGDSLGSLRRIDVV